MTRVTVSRSIAVAPEIVFRAVSDVPNLPETMPDIVNIEFLTEQRSGAGTRFRETRRMGKNKQHVTELEVTEYDADRHHVRMVADTNGTVWDTVFTVVAQGGGAHLTIAMDARPHKLLPKLLNPIFKGLFRRGMDKHIAAVKAHLEGKRS